MAETAKHDLGSSQHGDIRRQSDNRQREHQRPLARDHAVVVDRGNRGPNFRVVEYRARHAEMTAVINSEPLLAPGFRDKAARYLDGFFALLDDPAKVDAEITHHCR